MTKKLNLSVIAIFVFSLMLSISCTKDNDLSENDNTFSRKFNFKSINSKETTLTNYKINTSNSNIDFADQVINLEIPVPLNDFHFEKAYNISNENQAAILLIISRNSTEYVNDLPVNYTIDTNISFKEINLDEKSLENKPNLNIFVMNNVRAFNEDDAILANLKGNNTPNSNLSFNSNMTSKSDGPYTVGDGTIIIVDED